MGCPSVAECVPIPSGTILLLYFDTNRRIGVIDQVNLEGMRNPVKSKLGNPDTTPTNVISGFLGIKESKKNAGVR
jgi:hypothetical protein